MRSLLLVSAALLVAAAPPAKLKAPSEIVAEAPASAWRDINPDNLVVMDLRNGARVVIQLAPEFAPVHVANIRALAKGNWWSGAAIYRVQDNYVVQWGNNESTRPLPPGVIAKPPAEYHRSLKGLSVRPLGYADDYAPSAGFAGGWPIGYDPKTGTANLTHCYGYVGVGRDLSPDTGTGGELYAVIGHAPRHLDRNIAVVGRVIEGIDRLSSLPRGTEALGFYKDESMQVPISAVRLASEIPATERPAYQFMDTGSATFGAYVKARANRKDDFFIRPAGGVDLCNAAVPVRKKSA
ncbi:peptidylprolyl isomerase [Sphingomonas sediminicola]|uniref:peptidylprolyl isomerase n=1 Tax=Sphingomonas sediminicola TaxID=386874 RepID=A0ABX6T8Y5_9SPHN|nr:peptidylprolyl isomerase [Sphingomonas sediminicola]QNP45703.1 peptidylprolyl isomerase [Sphingomonas sediminicola]